MIRFSSFCMEFSDDLYGIGKSSDHDHGILLPDDAYIVDIGVCFRNPGNRIIYDVIEHRYIMNCIDFRTGCFFLYE